MEELLKKVKDIRGICADRLGAITADGFVLGELFDEIEETLAKEIEKTKKKN